MATKISCASGNWTEPSTWAVCDPTAESDSMATTGAVSTSYQASSNFTTGAVTVDGVAINFASVGAISAITGTLSVKLYNATDLTDVAGTETTVNVADLFSNDGVTVSLPGWRFIKFAAPVTLVAGKAYNLQIKRSSSTSSLLVYVTAGTNWSRQLRTTTTAAPAAGDKLYVFGELTGPGTGNDVVVTMNNNDSTDYGTGSTTIPSICVGKRGILTWPTAVNTQLRFSGEWWITDGGFVRVGTNSTPVQDGYTARILFDSASAAEFGIAVQNGGSLEACGAAKTPWTLLASDVAAGATSITVLDATGWKIGDQIAIAPTRRVRAECETRTISAITGNVVTLSSALTYPHSALAHFGVEVVNVTRNVKFYGNSTSATGFIGSQLGGNGRISLKYVEVYYFGTTYYTNGQNTYKGGINLGNAALGYGYVGYCGFHDLNSSAYCTVFYSPSVQADNQTSEWNASYGTFYGAGAIAGKAATNLHIRNNCFLMPYTGIFVSECNPQIVGNRVSGAAQNGQGINISSACNMPDVEDNFVSECHEIGYYILAAKVTLRNCHERNNCGTTSSLHLGGLTMSNADVLLERCTFEGDASWHVNPLGVVLAEFRNCLFDSNPTYTTPYVVQASDLTRPYRGGGLMVFKNCKFGAMSPHTTADILQREICSVQLVFVGCEFHSSTRFVSLGANNQDTQGILILDDNQASARPCGTLIKDSTIFSGAAPSLRLTPNTSARTMKGFIGYNSALMPTFGKFQVALKAGDSATVSVKVRESVAGDGTDYDGQRVRLFVEGHPALQYEHVTNGSFTTDTSGWTAAGGATLSSVSGGVSGNCLRISTGGAGAQARQTLTTVAGHKYTVFAALKPGSTDGCAVKVGTTEGAGDLWTSQTVKTTTAWRFVVGTFTAAGTTTYLSLCDMGTAEGITTHFDEVSVVNVSEDTVLATATAASEGNWETLTGVVGPVYADCVLSFYVDCGGTGYTQGWVNVDDWDATPKNDTKGGKFWPHLVGDNAAAGGGGGGRAFGYIGG